MHAATPLESMLYPEPLTESRVTKPARMSDVILEEIVTFVLGLCHFAEFLKPLCPIPQTGTHGE